MKIKYLKLAKIEFDDAIKFYNTQQMNLGKYFQTDIKKSISRIKEFPYAYIELKHKIRRCVIHKFPYSILYSINKGTILIIAIANQHREPDYWVNRINNFSTK
jgi:hypothetical protein